MIKNLNLIKTIGIFFVVIIHFGPIAYNYENNILTFNFYLVYRSLLSIGVPLLLLVSGYLLTSKNYSISKILKRIIHIFLLIVIFKFIYALTITFKIPSFDEFIYSLTTTSAKGYRVNSLWYLYALIAIFFLLPILNIVAKNKKVYTYLTVLVISYPFLFKKIELLFNGVNEYNMQLFQTLFPFQTQYLFAIALFIVGGWFKLNEEKFKIRINVIFLAVIILLLLIIQSFIAIFIANASGNLFDPMYDGYSTFTCFINSCLIFYILRYQANSIDNKLINIIADNTLGIYLIHWPIAYYLKNSFMKNPLINIYIDNIFLSIVILFLSLLISFLLRKNFLTAKLVKF